MSTSAEELHVTRARVRALVAAGDLESLYREVEGLHPSDIADIVELLEEDQQVQLLSALPPDVASEALAEMEEGEERGDLLAAFTPQKGAELLHELADDDAADLIGELEPEEQRAIFDALSEEDAGDLRDLLEYDEETAGGLMTTALVKVRGSLTAAQAIDEVRLQGREVEHFYTIFVVDEADRLLGTLRLADLVIATPEDPIEGLVEAPLATALPDLDQEQVGRLIARYNLASMPVVSGAGILLGRITFDDVIDVMETEQTEDILLLAGVSTEDELKHGWIDSVRVRLPWLLLNLLTASLAASVILIFEDTIAQITTLAFIAPIIAAMGGSSGTQSLAITIRRITVEGRGSARGFVGKEILIGLVNGAVLGLGLGVLAFFIPGANPKLGAVAMVAMWGNQIVAGFAGAFVPTTLERMGVDPSVASSVFINTLTDLCGFFLLLGLASRFLL
jgi:magnesium transporter